MSNINKVTCGVSTTSQLLDTVNGLVDSEILYGGIKDLPQVDGVTLSVKGFYVGSDVGCGQFYYDPSRSKADHNGGTVIAPEAIAAWDGSVGDIATLLDWTGVGSGCFVRFDLRQITTPAMFGGIEDKVSVDADLFVSGVNAIRGSYGSGGMSGNLSIGDGSLNGNASGDGNTAIGKSALLSSTTGSNNTALGSFALPTNTTGESNTVIGRAAMNANTTGSNNIGVGRGALNLNTVGSGNIGIGGRTSSGVYSPVFDPTTENNRISIGSTSVTNAYVQVAWTVVSDRRDKTNIKDLELGLDFISQLKPVSYNFRLSRDSNEVNGNKRYGFIAQDILAVEGDDAVIIDNEAKEKLKFNDQSLQAVMVKAIQDLNEIVKQQAVEIQALKGGN